MKLTPMAVCLTCTSSAAGAPTSTTSSRKTSGPPVSWMRIARGTGTSCRFESRLLRVPALAVLGEIEAFGLLVFRHAQPRDQRNALEDRPGQQSAPRCGREHAECLHTHLRQDVLLHRKAHASQRHGA